MSRRNSILIAAAAAALLVLLAVFRSHDEPYTARVVDAETGQPVAGAIYLAVWWKESFGRKPWWEGTAPAIDSFVEGKTGADGIIRVPGFWRRRIAFNQNTLTVYKPGYVLWFQEKIFPKYTDRTDFDREHRIVRLVKWDNTLSYGAHHRFLFTATKSSFGGNSYARGERALENAFDKYESAMYLEERLIK